jgi:polar amino acid transport system substrate-binding protein
MLSSRRRLVQAGALALLPGAARAAGGPFRMAYFETYSPLSYRGDNGALRGILVDILDDVLGRQMGVPMQHTGYPWLRAQAMAKLGEVDAICTIATSARLEYAAASSEVVVAAPRRIFVRADNPLLADLQQVHDLAGLRQLRPVVVSYIGNGWGAENLTGFKMAMGTDYDAGLKMLIAKRGDVMIDNSLTMQFSLSHVAGGEQVLMLPARLESSDFRLLISKLSLHVALLPAFDKALMAYKKTAAYGEVFKKYGVKI